MARLGLAGAGPSTAAEPAPEGAVDLVDQAEAFQDLRVNDVMTPRADVVALDISCPLEDVVARFVESEHTRIPLYRETLDDPVGVVHLKDVMKLIAPGPNREQPDWTEQVLHRIRREVLYVPASMRAADLLLKMQSTRIHMALVIDEFGGTDGLATMEDLIEAVVGEIEDEHDEHVAAAIVERPGGLIEADARAPLEDLEALMGVSLSPADLDEEIDTIAGLVATIAGRVPQRGEVIHHPAGYDFEVLDADPRRLKRLRIHRVEPVGGVEA
jgi:CBS domain containing-hemolysin-like protein